MYPYTQGLSAMLPFAGMAMQPWQQEASMAGQAWQQQAQQNMYPYTLLPQLLGGSTPEAVVNPGSPGLLETLGPAAITGAAMYFGGPAGGAAASGIGAGLGGLK
jgi:hypothetical protein